MSSYKTSGQITTLQTQAVVISTILGVGVLSFPQFMAKIADSGAPLVTFAGIVLSFIALVPLALVGRKFPGQNLLAFSQLLIGKWLTVLFSTLVILLFLAVTGITLRQTSEAITLIVLPTTPVEVVSLLMLMILVLSSRRNIVKFSYIHYFYLPFILVPFIIILMSSLKYGEYINLLPVIGVHPRHLAEGTLMITGLFQVSFVLAIVLPHMSNPKKALSASLWAIASAAVFYLFIVIASVAVFGAEEMKQMVFPTLELARSTSLSFGGLQRVDGIFIIIWVLMVFTTLFSTYYICLYFLCRMFNLEDHRWLATWLFPFVYAFSLLPRNVFQLYQMGNLLNLAGLGITFGYPLLLWVMSLFRKGVVKQ